MRTILLVLFLPLFAFSQTPVATVVDSLMRAHVAAREFNGNVLVARGGTIIYQKSFGYRDYNTREPLDSASVFDLASVSKQFTAMGILLLRERGKLALSDSLRKFFPELPYPNTTIRHLLTHTSGLPDYEEAMNAGWDHSKIAFNADMIGFLAARKTPRLFEPGKRWEYSNTAYALLASIVEKVSGQTFGAFLKANVFSPLGMSHTRIYNTRRSTTERIPNYAYGFVHSQQLDRYIVPDSVPHLRFVHYLDGIQGDGVVNSTTGDLFKWSRALKESRLLPSAVQKEMLSAQAFVDSTAVVGYGYGVFVEKDSFGTHLSHSGGWPGYTSFLSYRPDEDITVIVLSNNNANATVISLQLTHLLHNKPVQFPYVHQEVGFDATYLQRFTGRYQGGNVLEIFRKGNKLFRKGNPTIELKAESETKLFYADRTDRQIEFVFDKKGKVEQAWFVSNGFRSPLKKLD